MGARQELANSAVLRNPESGEVVILAVGAPLPKWAEGLVDGYLLAPLGTAAKAEARARQEKAEARATARRRAAEAAAGEEAPLYDDGLNAVDDQDEASDVDDELDEDGGDEPAGLTEPPRAGRGSGIEAWTTYVEALELEIPDGASRDDLIELVDQHNDES